MTARSIALGPTLASLAGALVVLVYLAQQVTMAPNHVDEGYLLESVRLVAQGQRVFWDFIDIYGPLNYDGPAFFYNLAGGKAWGSRVWVLLVKIVCLLIAYPAVRRVTDRTTAWLTVAWYTVLLGLPWQAMQMPFAFLHCVPLLLASYALVIDRPLRREWLNWLIAGGLTGAALLIKSSTGAFLLAGGAFYCAYWLPAAPAGETSSPPAPGSPVLRLVEAAGLFLFGAAFLYFVRRKVDPLFYLYFDLPVLVFLIWTGLHVRGGRTFAPFARRARAASIYLAASLGSALLIGWWRLGVRGSVEYVREMRVLISAMLYEHPVLPLGEPGMYRGFNEYYWMQLPWGITLLFLVWASLAASGLGARAFGPAWPAERARGSGLFACATLGVFVFYQYGTEVHLLSALLGAGPCLFVLLYQLRRMLEQRATERGNAAAAGALKPSLTAAVAVWLTTIAYWPSLDALRWPPGDWTVSTTLGRRASENRLAHLRYRERTAPGIRETDAALPDDEWDRLMNDAAVFVDEITDDEEEVLVLSADEIIPYHSFTRHVGGRYRLAFFWLRIGLLDREGFDRVVPPRVVAELLRDPPRVIVSAYGGEPVVVSHINELAPLSEAYELVRSFSYIQIYQRQQATGQLRP